MLEYDRLTQIITILQELKSVSVSSLAKKLYVSEATVRRDLTQLEKKGALRRVFGGAILLESDQNDIPFFSRSTEMDAIKSTIAQQASGFVINGQTLMLDASSTVSMIIPHLRRFKGLTIITNAIAPMSGLQDLDAKVMVIGGQMLRNSLGYVGSYAEEMVRNFNADVFFFSCGGISSQGRISDRYAEETTIRKEMLRHSRIKVLLCDSTKFGKEFCYNLSHIDEVDHVISDVPDPLSFLSKISN